ncbi:MAG: S46 family peptidase [Saprospiraceae bacterium]|nr:S46 family peptidase [Candidatus Defluviibacterium haderslevense]
MRISAVVLILLVWCQSIFAGEGMWLPILLQSMNESEMQSMGMKMKAEDIYSVNKGSLKDAIVQFGGGCTAEIISSKGLLLTNHHCGYGYIQSYSSVEHNYIKYGYWAINEKKEWRCNGLTVTMIVRMEDVTLAMLDGVLPTMNESERKIKVDQNLIKVKSSISKASYEDVMIRPFYNGNQYFAFVTVTYKDIRFVGKPPESIGDFGANTDNLEWPRHTGDFSLYRIYAGKDNLPAAYSEDNIPYTPKYFLPISLDGVEEGDFTMLFGFPGRTNEYLTKEGVRQIANIQNPVRIALREKVLKILDKYMRNNEKTKIQYASKYAGSANVWKKWKGESQGIKNKNALEKKDQWDKLFQERVNNNETFQPYRNIIGDLETYYTQLQPMTLAKEYYAEGFQRNTDLYAAYSRIKKLADTYEGRGNDLFVSGRDEMKKNAAAYFKDVDINIEKEVLSGLIELVVKGVEPEVRFPYLIQQLKTYNNNYSEYVNDLYNKSCFATPDSLVVLSELEFVPWITRVKADPVWNLYEELNYFLVYGIQNQAGPIEDAITALRRRHMEALIKVFPEKKFYPDANSTLRVSYGKIEGYSPKDGVKYNAKTYLDGVMEKYIPGDYEFDVEPKLIKLYKEKDYGVYGENGKMPLAFISSSHTTGGSSGSPAIDAHGNLIGLNFDRNWEGMMSDINYDVTLCRNIMVDARYILFIIDKFAGAGQLIQEMKLAHPKEMTKGKRKRG